MTDLDFGNIFSSITKPSVTTEEANNEVFTTEVMKQIAEVHLAQYKLIEAKITELVNKSVYSKHDLTGMISTLRNVSLTYLPKV